MISARPAVACWRRGLREMRLLSWSFGVKQPTSMEARMKLKLTEELWKEGNMYVSYCPELDIASCGETVDQAKKNLKEVILINLEEAQKLGALDSLKTCLCS